MFIINVINFHKLFTEFRCRFTNTKAMLYHPERSELCGDNDQQNSHVIVVLKDRRLK